MLLNAGRACRGNWRRAGKNGVPVTSKKLPVVVIGGGISGMTVAVEAAEAGAEVLLVEKEPLLGGKVVRFHQSFPKLHSPETGLEMHVRRIRANERITLLTGTEALGLSGCQGDFTLDLLVKPRMVRENCTLCHKCAEVCPVEIEDRHNYAMTKSKAIHLPMKGTHPYQYIIEENACLKNGCGKCKAVCQPNAIDFDEQPKRLGIRASTVVLATGWEPFDAAKLANFGFGVIPNVISNVMMERMASPQGPTGGKIVRPSDNMPAGSIAFVQCAGQRDEKYLPYCSVICCLVSFKQAYYVRQANPNAEVNIIYTELSNPCPGRYDKFISLVMGDEKIVYTKGKVTQIREDRQSGEVVMTVKDPANRGAGIQQVRADMAVLATGMVPSILGGLLNEAVVLDQNGFAKPEMQKAGIYITGVAKNPGDVTTSMLDAAYTALRTTQGIRQ